MTVLPIYQRYLEQTKDVSAAACLTLAEVVQSQARCATIPPTDALSLTVKEVAARLRVSTKRVYALCADNDLQAFKVGRSLRVPADVLERYIQAAKPIRFGGRLNRCL